MAHDLSDSASTTAGSSKNEGGEHVEKQSKDENKGEVDLEHANKDDVEQEDQKKSPWARRQDAWFSDWWSWEFLGLLWAFAVLAVIIALLVIYNNRPQSDWPGRISLNSTVALLTTIAKLGFAAANTSALGQLRWNWYSSPRPLIDWNTFDDASRGSPYGSASLMWKIRGFHLAPIGAFVSLAAIFFSSLTQQALNFVTESGIDPTGTAIMPRSFSYSGPSTQPFQVQGAPTTFVAPSNSKVLAAVSYVAYNGTKEIQPGFGLSSTCSTGNCQYDIFSSLAACARCETDDAAVVEDCSSGRCDYTLAASNSTASSLMTGNVINTTSSDRIYTTLNMSAIATVGEDFGIFNVTSLFTNYTAVGMPSNDVSLTSGTTRATTCRLSICVKAFNSSVVNGTFQERVLNFTLLNAADRTSNGTINELPIPLNYLPANTTLSIAPASLTILGRSIADLYSGAVVIAPGQGSGALDTNMITTYGLGYTSNTLQGLYNNNTINLTSAADHVATVITNIIRSEGNSSGFIYGSAYQTQSYLRVKWAWILYPAGLELLVAIFLVATIFKTRNSGVQNTWKSNPLALLFHGLEANEGALKNMAELGKLHEMTTLSKKIRVKLKRTEKQTRLVCARGEDSDQESEEEGEHSYEGEG